ncbi:alpha/beta hydrolase family protein [Pseudidiomarina insulisalsae]|uniref:S9 family peptidase n=1 Tax=Pseudidiomarina insulisalsae TaxID=575789 RepID=A0A432YPA5_9GAMM|nr:S9 family peptidase [Pseudidiomarina insulisalsae]RUO62946.1 S9 family peptidase [Pseudidiomarina insulisalsae]
MSNNKWLFSLLLSSLVLACSPAQENAPADAGTTRSEPTRQVTQYDAETFFATTTLFGSSVSHDNKEVLVTSDADGIFNVYSYAVNDGSKTQLTQSTADAYAGISWFPDDKRFLYTADQGGNELNHLYVRELDGSVQDLTPGENLKASFLGWRADDQAFFVMTNERDPASFDIYRYQVSDYSREMVFKNEGGWAGMELSPNGEWLALAKVNSNKDTDIYLLNMTSEAAQPQLITDSDKEVAHTIFSFTPNSQQLIYGTNAYGEFVQAWAYELNTGQHAVEYADDWDVMFVYFSDRGSYQVIGVNADASTELTILDRDTGEPIAMPDFPAGDLQGVNFSDDESLLIFYLNSDTSPSNLYVWQVGSDQVSRLTDTLSPAINPQHLVASEVVRFESFDGIEIPNILYRPHQASAENPVPAVIFIHGGPGGQTRKGYSPLLQHLVNHGYAILGINNRGSSGYGTTFYHLDDRRHGEDDLQDIVYGKQYLQSLPWVANDQIAVMGGSYGGYLTMAALAFTDEFDAGINIFGVTNWVRTLESIPPWWATFRQSLYDELGDPAEHAERLRRISPLFHADQVQAPVLIVQGANDPRVLQVESDEMVAAIRENGVPVEYVLFEDEGHGFRNKENRIEAQEAYLNFLNTYLKQEPMQ